MATYDLTANSITLTNMLTDGGMESGQWNGGSYSTSQYHSGTKSLQLASGGTYVPTLSVATLPVVGHKYYAARWIKSDGDNQPADCRWEWYAGDGAGLNYIFGWNRGYHATWERESIIYTVDAVNGSSYYIRCFVVNSTANTWIDDMILVDLTTAFGAGNEPDKDWCDSNIPYFSGTLPVSLSLKLKKGDILNCPYSGTYKTITLPKGIYKLECWGAQGGYRSSTSYGGKGGYSYGTLTLKNETTVYIYSGGAGNTGGVNGGFNGGGARYSYNGGGGGSDIRLGQDSLYARVIVAGGGGSDGAMSKQGMYGGGTTGGIATQSYGSYGYGGAAIGNTQSATSYVTTSKPTSNSSTAWYNGFGFGGYGCYASSGYAGAGGGGWYGGCGSYPDGSGDDDRGGGGGSGYVYTSSTYSSYPSGCLLNSSYYLTDASTIEGNASFVDYSGSTVTGHSGDGAIRITVIKVASLPFKFKVDGAIKEASSAYAKIDGIWKPVSTLQSKIDAWK